jgi:UDP-N-acetylglucosamine acyltransferase
LAAVSPEATISPNVRIGPFSVVEADVAIGPGCILEAHVVVKAGTRLGPDNHVFEGAVLGGFPQHVHVPDCPGKVVIGSGNTIRENVTVHRALEADRVTVIGDDNLFMVNAHVAHDCHLGNHTIITNNVMLAGHVTVEDRAYLSGAAAVHQFCRVGTLAMLGGQAHLVKDVPPFVTVDGLSSLVVGLNQIGLRRAGFERDEIRQLKAAYRVIYRSGLTWAEILKRLKSEFPDGPAALFYPFLSITKRGITNERRGPSGATIKLPRATEATSQILAKAG